MTVQPSNLISFLPLNFSFFGDVFLAYLKQKMNVLMHWLLIRVLTAVSADLFIVDMFVSTCRYWLKRAPKGFEIGSIDGNVFSFFIFDYLRSCYAYSVVLVHLWSVLVIPFQSRCSCNMQELFLFFHTHSQTLGVCSVLKGITHLKIYNKNLSLIYTTG